MGSSHLARLRQAHARRLEVLEERQSLFGVSTPPEIVIEIEDLQEKIKAIDLQLTSDSLPPQAAQSGMPTQTAAQPTTTLRELLAESFSLSELRTLCSDLGIDHEDIPGTEKISFARELIQYTKRRGRLNDLIAECKRLRSHVQWPNG